MANSKLRAEIASLRAENERLKAELTTPGDYSIPKTENTDGVNKKSPAMDKVALFMELFHGREDVYAKQWYSSKTNKSGHSPVCQNEWLPGVCDKKRYKCALCPQKRFQSPDSSAVYRHLSGKTASDVMFVYPLTSEDCCHFLVIKFNESSWQDDVNAFRMSCGDLSLLPAIEITNEGANIWFFFKEKIPAALARRFGSALLTNTMNKRHELPFSLYDKLFPNSDATPHGYFGSPIALPLQGLARKSGYSVFVDENLKPHIDQWDFLSRCQRLAIQQLEDIIRKLGGNTELGQLALKENETDSEPWNPYTRESDLSAMDFPEKVKIIKANMLHIHKEGISQVALNRLRRLAAFRNPEYAKAERMRLPIRDLPRIIDCARETREYLSLPRGCEEALKALFKNIDKNINIIDERNAGVHKNIQFNGELRHEQKPAANAMLRHETGVLSATTAFGKTVLGAYMIAQRQVNSLILVHNTALLNQWKRALEEFLVIKEDIPIEFDKRGRKKKTSLIGRLGAGKNELHGIVDVAVMQSLVSGDEVREIVQNYGMVIVDECHHVSAVSFEKILRQVRAKYIYGLSATPSRQDGLQPIVFMQCGDIRYRVNPKEQAAKSGFERYVVPRFTAFKTPPYLNEKDLTISSFYSQIAEDINRNKLIVKDVKYALKKGRTPIILTKLTSHVDYLSSELSKICPQVIALTGKASAKEKRAAMERLKGIPEGESFIIVATGQFVGEGFDEPRLDTLFLASPISWKGTLQQYAGRLHRVYSGKENVIIFDYVDVNIRMLEAMFHKRLKEYGAMSYRAMMPGCTAKKENTIFNISNFQSTLVQDISLAKNEIVFVSPQIKKSYIEKMIKLLSPAFMNSVTIAVITRTASSYKAEEQEMAAALLAYLREYGVKVTEKNYVHQCYTIFDRKTVWYGGLNLLGYSQPEASVMRFENADIAAELLFGI